MHVPNVRSPNRFGGQSELQHVTLTNRELGERLSDQADSIRYHADPPTVFKGVTDHSCLPRAPGANPSG